MTTITSLRTIFEPLRQYFEEANQNQSQVIDDIKDYGDDAPDTANALITHMVDVTNEIVAANHETPDIAKDIVKNKFHVIAAESYFRTFFDPETAAQYGTNYFDGDPDRLREFVAAFVTNETIKNAANHPGTNSVN